MSIQPNASLTMIGLAAPVIHDGRDCAERGIFRIPGAQEMLELTEKEEN